MNVSCGISWKKHPLCNLRCIKGVIEKIGLDDVGCGRSIRSSNIFWVFLQQNSQYDHGTWLNCLIVVPYLFFCLSKVQAQHASAASAEQQKQGMERQRKLSEAGAPSAFWCSGNEWKCPSHTSCITYYTDKSLVMLFPAACHWHYSVAST